MKIVLFLLLHIFALASPVFAAQQVGSFVALRGNVAIERPSGRVDARVKSPVELSDTVATGAASRAKLLFLDDSVLSLGDNSRLNIQEFVHSTADRGKSIFNLLDGKMRAVVGKTRFQVETPTAVAAARGTVIYFEVGKSGARHYTKIICLEGVVDVRSKVPGDTVEVELTQGRSITIIEGEPLRPMDGSNNLPLSPQVKNSVTVVPAASGVPVDKSPDASTETKDGETKQQGSSVAKKTASAIIPSDAGAVAGIPEIASARADTSLGIPEISIPRVTLQEIMPLPGALVDFLPAVLPVSIQQLPPPLLPTAVSIRIHF